VTAHSTIVPGAILLQKYRIEKVLGQGGMGTVFAAHHLALNERVAIKVLMHSASQHQEALARLQREARILARLRNEHVVHVIDLGRLADGSPFMVMEQLAGRDLASLLEEEGRLTVERAVGFVLQALVALSAAHANSIVHRDLKPDNLFCAERRDGSSVIKVLDFGISRLEQLDEGQGATPLTNPSAVMGTPLYMSPEQWRDSTAVDGRSDIWSIGVVLHELVTGVSPFSGASLGDIAIKVATEPAPPLSHVEPRLAPALEAVLARCLQKDRELRFANVAELARALQPLGPAGCEQLVERAVRLAAEPPLDPLELESSALSAAAEVVAPSTAAVASPPTPPPSLAERRGHAFSFLSAALAGLATLVAAASWLLLPSSATPDATGTLTEQPAASSYETPVLGAPVIAATAAQPERPLLTSGEPLPAPDPSKASSTMARPRANAASKGPCNPPYTVDAQGRKKFRHECFTERSPR
jgi:serine/threonine protein kinase